VTTLADHAPLQLGESDQRRLGPAALRLSSLLLGAGLLLLGLSLLIALISPSAGLPRFQYAYLTAYVFVLSLGLGALGFLLLTTLFRGGWHVLFRRIPETLGAAMLVMVVLTFPLIWFVMKDDGQLYSWAQPASQIVYPDYFQSAGADDADHHADDAGHHAYADGDPMLLAKRPWLNAPFFSFRIMVYAIIWALMGLFFWRNSLRQDETGDPQLTRRAEMLSPVGTIIYALTITFAMFDLIMSLDWTWYSTIFGVYVFAGAMQAVLATTIVLLWLLQRQGYFPSISREHYHDLGKLLFAFIFFWGYIAYSQYMLLWYASLPGTTPWLAIRGVSTADGQWTPITYQVLLLLVGLFIVPFAFLLSRHIKRNLGLLVLASCWILVMRYVDLHWLIMPQYGTRFALEDRFIAFGPIELTCVLGMTAIYFAVAIRMAQPHALVPARDPRLAESLRFHNI